MLRGTRTDPSTAIGQWHDQPTPELTAVAETVPASITWLLSGDAGQRALTAWNMGWQAAIEASGSNWQGPLLAQLLVDPYDVVRFAAYRSLRRQPGFDDFDYDFVASEDQRMAGHERARAIWERVRREDGEPTDLNFMINDPHKKLPQDMDIYARLLELRDDRPMTLAE